MFDIYTTRQLAAVVAELRQPSSFLLDTFFPFVMPFETEMIDFDLLTKNQGLAPFVSPLVAGRPVLDRGFTTKSFKPAYVKPKNKVDASRPLKRRAGERIGGDLSPSERRDAIISDLLLTQLEMIKRRKEWMAAQVLTTGKVVVEGEDYPKQEVDFGRDAALDVTAVGTARWGESASAVIDDLENLAGLTQTKSGAAATTIVMDPKAWTKARLDANFLAVLDNRRQATGSVELGPVALGTGEQASSYVGSLGRFNLWVYQQSFTDDAGANQQFLPDYTVIAASIDGLEGVQAQGAINDPRAGFAAVETFPTNWISEDPVAEFVMTQSAPLVVPSRPNASATMTVHDGL